MREIKFRGKRKYGPEILIGDLNHINGQVFIMPRTDDTPLNSPDWFEVDPETVGQFTGLVHEGRELWEGDILNFFILDAQEKGVVKFSKGGFWTSQPDGYDEQILSEEIADLKFEIIGTVFQNPELI